MRHSTVTTRKPHMCHGCYRVIPAGNDMLASVNVDGSDIYTLYVCNVCQEAMKRYDFADYDGIFQEGCCVEDSEDRELWEVVLNETQMKIENAAKEEHS